MRSLGYPVEAFSSAADFLASRSLDTTACLIADIQMPGMTGFELYAHLIETGQKIPTILVTAMIDPMISREYALELAGWYLGNAPSRTPLAAPIHADLRGLPPFLIQVGSAETLLDDSIQIAGRAGAADVRVTLEIWPDMVHAWPLFHQQLTDGRRAIAAAGSFIRTATG